MIKSFFTARCPLELGDTVAILPGKAATIYYLPDGVKLDEETAKTAELHTVTDIAATHYLKTQKVVFSYQLDNTEDYISYEVITPAEQMQTAIESGRGLKLP